MIGLHSSALRRGYANLLCIVPLGADDPPEESTLLALCVSSWRGAANVFCGVPIVTDVPREEATPTPTPTPG